ncbi:hypothetical protein Sta7437_0837 [Stanieria cyanosphaera PCC 7437]|uniref:Uncharacterized protein n=1 Tax=Stanieria cyanosphaera (strain ATCC 29371 / PCC 7437) TaxID=111780 RepID=K9XP85_STAC7|nr:hypothetical protein [Stanieria cyanosphaera]AFZ34425.1 hypothetical protein Sta7437_0837 [Stanieria cyanosphaera PCC 7437]
MKIKDLDYIEANYNSAQVVGGLIVNIYSIRVNQIASSRGSAISYGGDTSVAATSFNITKFS